MRSTPRPPGVSTPNLVGFLERLMAASCCILPSMCFHFNYYSNVYKVTPPPLQELHRKSDGIRLANRKSQSHFISHICLVCCFCTTLVVRSSYDHIELTYPRTLRPIWADTKTSDSQSSGLAFYRRPFSPLHLIRTGTTSLVTKSVSSSFCFPANPSW